MKKPMKRLKRGIKRLVLKGLTIFYKFEVCY